jgi:hypothetical protein
MQDLVLMEPLFCCFVVTMVFGFAIVPTIGGAIIWKTFQIAKFPNFTFKQCWKAYLYACAYAYLVVIVINAIHGTAQGLEVLHLILFCGIPFLVVTLYLRNFSPRVLAVEAVALVIVDAAAVSYVLLSHA